MSTILDTDVLKKNPLIGKIEAMAAKAKQRTTDAKDKTLPVIKTVETIADSLDEGYVVTDNPCSSVKIDMQSLENPFYSLTKRADTKVRLFEYNVQRHRKSRPITIEIIPSVIGGATIYDKDILTYCSSVIMATLQSNPDASVYRRVRFSAYRYLIDTHRVKSSKNIGGKDYTAVEMSLKRLKGTNIFTNIPSNGKIYTDGFNLIDNYQIIRDEASGKMEAIEIVLSKYYYDAIINREILTQSPKYYQIRSSFAKRMYEIARKHCGNQTRQVEFYYETLHIKSGSTAVRGEFMRMMRKIVKDGVILDYCFYEKKKEGKFVIFRNNIKSKAM